MISDKIAKAALEGIMNADRPMKNFIVTPPRQSVDNFRIAWDRCAPDRKGGETSILTATFEVDPDATRAAWSKLSVTRYTCYGRQSSRLLEFMHSRSVKRFLDRMYRKQTHELFYGTKISTNTTEADHEE
jgi:hypothetical protein